MVDSAIADAVVCGRATAAAPAQRWRIAAARTGSAIAIDASVGGALAWTVGVPRDDTGSVTDGSRGDRDVRDAPRADGSLGDGSLGDGSLGDGSLGDGSLGDGPLGAGSGAPHAASPGTATASRSETIATGIGVDVDVGVDVGVDVDVDVDVGVGVGVDTRDPAREHALTMRVDALTGRDGLGTLTTLIVSRTAWALSVSCA